MTKLKEGISVIIASYNRPDIFQSVFESYLNCDQVKELILINDGSTMDYGDLYKTINNFCREKQIAFKYIKNKKRKGAPACRNIGLKKAEYRYLFFSDDDMYLAEGTMDYLLITLKQKKVQAAGCRIYYLSMAEYQDNISKWDDYSNQINITNILPGKNGLTGLVMEKTKEKYVSVDHVSGTIMYDNLFLKENRIRFYENYRGNGFREETDAQIQVRRCGGKILFCSGCVCFHLPYEILGSTGQRRSGKLWYEFWIFVNNLIFYRRHSGYFTKNLKISMIKFLWLFNKERLEMILNKLGEKYIFSQEKTGR